MPWHHCIGRHMQQMDLLGWYTAVLLHEKICPLSIFNFPLSHLILVLSLSESLWNVLCIKCQQLECRVYSIYSHTTSLAWTKKHLNWKHCRYLFYTFFFFLSFVNSVYNHTQLFLEWCYKYNGSCMVMRFKHSDIQMKVW